MNDLPCQHEHEKANRPLPDMSAAVVALCDQASALLTKLTNGSSIGIRPAPQLFPAWSIEIFLVPRK